MAYIDYLASKMSAIPIDAWKHNAVFTDGDGNYRVDTFPIEDTSFDDLIQRMLTFNSQDPSVLNGERCIMIQSPNWVLKGLRYLDFKALESENLLGYDEDTKELETFKILESMLIFCAPMEDDKVVNNGIRAKGLVGSEYLVPDKRQVAADIVAEDARGSKGIGEASLLTMALSALRAGKRPEPVIDYDEKLSILYEAI